MTELSHSVQVHLPHSSHALLWKSRSQKSFKMCSVFSKREIYQQERTRQISFMVWKYPVVDKKQAIPARTSEHTRKYNRTSHCLWCPETGGFKLSSKTFDSISFTLMDGSTGDSGARRSVDGLHQWSKLAKFFLLHALFVASLRADCGLGQVVQAIQWATVALAVQVQSGKSACCISVCCLTLPPDMRNCVQASLGRRDTRDKKPSNQPNPLLA